MEYEDIGQSREWEDIEYINKGWSDDKKYKIKTRENEELLLKISDIGQFAKKKKEFEIIKDLEEKKILMPKAVDIGVCNNDQSIYSLYTWIKGEDAAEEISKFSEEEQYKLGVNAGRYLKEIHSVNAPKSIEDWESRFNRKQEEKTKTTSRRKTKVKGSETTAPVKPEEKTQPKKEIKYEEAVAQLEEIVDKMENDELDIDQLSDQLKRAKELVKLCKDKLTKTDEEIKKLLSEDN